MGTHSLTPSLPQQLLTFSRIIHDFTRAMLTQESNGGARNSWARVCYTCRSAASTVYCRSDCAFLCSSCDARIHVASRHDRVWVCEACERAPAAFLCKADAASLCTTCDADIHSANSLASRHHRVPIMPIPGCLYGPVDHNDDEDEAASWLLLNPAGKNLNNNNGFLFGDEYLDLVEEYSNNQQQHSVPDQKSYGGDSVVPVQPKEQLHQQQSFNLGVLNYQSSKPYTYNGSVNHNVSASSIDVDVPAEPAMSSDISISHPRAPKGTIDLFCGPAIDMATQVSVMDREARVLRYREKKKMRKFEKTIRYASRKAYAESRPRIKGRFAKRREVEEVEVDQMFIAETTGYGIVPSF